MAIRVATDLVPLFPHPQYKFRILFGGAPDYKEGSFHRVISKEVQHARSVNRIRPVIDCDGNLRAVPIPMLK
jgi:hypothetical protein